MADAKITALGANTAPISTDIFPMVDDPGGTPATQKVTLANIMKAMEGCAKFWVEWIVATVVEVSFNVTSITDTANGDQTITIATDFAGVDWVCSPSVARQALTTATSCCYDAKAAGSVRIVSVVEAASGVDPDAATGNDSWSCVGWGTQ